MSLDVGWIHPGLLDPPDRRLCRVEMANPDPALAIQMNVAPSPVSKPHAPYRIMVDRVMVIRTFGRLGANGIPSRTRLDPEIRTSHIGTYPAKPMNKAELRVGMLGRWR